MYAGLPALFSSTLIKFTKLLYEEISVSNEDHCYLVWVLYVGKELEVVNGVAKEL